MHSCLKHLFFQIYLFLLIISEPLLEAKLEDETGPELLQPLLEGKTEIELCGNEIDQLLPQPFFILEGERAARSIEAGIHMAEVLDL